MTEGNKIRCLVHGTECLRCGVEMDFETDLLVKKEREKSKGLVEMLEEAGHRTPHKYNSKGGHEKRCLSCDIKKELAKYKGEQ